MCQAKSDPFLFPLSLSSPEALASTVLDGTLVPWWVVWIWFVVGRDTSHGKPQVSLCLGKTEKGSCVFSSTAVGTAPMADNAEALQCFCLCKEAGQQ